MLKTILLSGRFFAFFLFFVFLLPTFSFGEIVTIKNTVKQPFGGSQSPDDARISAMAKAKREALEQAGVYIESLTVVKNAMVEKDEILALAAGVLKTEVVSQKNYSTDDAFGIEIVVNVVVDTSVLEEKVKKHLQDKTHLTQLMDTQKREKELLQKIVRLEEENRKLSTSEQSTEKLKEQFQQASQGLTAVELVNKALSLWDGGKYTAPQKALEYLNNAIKLMPDYADAYYNRGFAYYNLGQHQSAIEDYNNAIRLKPEYAYAYNNRGVSYFDLGRRERAIEDYNEAIRLKPDNAEAYNNRGNAYSTLSQYQRAIENFNEAIRIKPDFVQAYYNKGLAYYNLGQHQSAVENYSEAIRLKPNYAEAYNNRGVVYLLQGNNNLGCIDAQKACALGDCKVSGWAKGKGVCP